MWWSIKFIATSQVFLLVFIDEFVVPESNFEFSGGRANILHGD